MHVLFDAIGTKKDRRGFNVDKGIAAIECVGCLLTKYGYPNDHGMPEHPLWIEGLSACQSSIVEVRGSPWLKEVGAQMTQSARRLWPEPPSKELEPGRHFIFLFREHTFECIASDLVVTLHSGPWPTVAATVLAARSWRN